MISIRRIQHLGFWHYHLMGWILFFLVQYFITSTYYGASAIYALEVVIQTVTGFFITYLLRRYYHYAHIQPDKIGSILIRITLLSIIATPLWYGCYLLFLYFIEPQIFQKGLSYQWTLQNIAYLFPVPLGWSALYFGIKFWLEWEHERDRMKQAIAMAQQAQLQMLRYQLNPHFLFNTLNSARALIDENVENARTLITELSEFLRYSLQSNNKTNVTVGEEMNAMRLYLSIEKRRYEDKIIINFDIDPSTEKIIFPSFLLHPLVENALKHGMQTTSLPLNIIIKSEVINGWLKISVINSGKLIQEKPEQLNGKGVGLMNVRNRLDERFHEHQRFSLFEQNGFVYSVIEIAVPERNIE
jgi:two-component system, LytTR family, sensor kinase